MSEVIVEAFIIRDPQDETRTPQSIDWSVIGLPRRTWFGLYLGETRIFRFRTDNDGNASGSESPVPEEYHIYLLSVGGFKFSIRLSNYIPVSDIIAGYKDIVEDTDNEGLPNIGTHELTLRYE